MVGVVRAFARAQNAGSPFPILLHVYVKNISLQKSDSICQHDLLFSTVLEESTGAQMNSIGEGGYEVMCLGSNLKWGLSLHFKFESLV